MSKTVRAYIGLGSNLGDREATLRFALQALRESRGVTIDAVSRVYETDPVGPGEQGAYLNAAIAVRSEFPPEILLDTLLAIERKAGRNRDAESERWSPRTLDLDLLFFGDTVMDTPALRLPHPRLHERAFVLEPLCELAPDFVHPLLHTSIAILADAVRDETAVKLWPNTLAIES